MVDIWWLDSLLAEFKTAQSEQSFSSRPLSLSRRNVPLLEKILIGLDTSTNDVLVVKEEKGVRLEGQLLKELSSEEVIKLKLKKLIKSFGMMKASNSKSMFFYEARKELERMEKENKLIEVEARLEQLLNEIKREQERQEEGFSYVTRSQDDEDRRTMVRARLDHLLDGNKTERKEEQERRDRTKNSQEGASKTKAQKAKRKHRKHIF